MKNYNECENVYYRRKERMFGLYLIINFEKKQVSKIVKRV